MEARKGGVEADLSAVCGGRPGQVDLGPWMVKGPGVRWWNKRSNLQRPHAADRSSVTINHISYLYDLSPDNEYLVRE